MDTQSVIDVEEQNTPELKAQSFNGYWLIHQIKGIGRTSICNKHRGCNNIVCFRSRGEESRTSWGGLILIDP